MGIKRFKYLLDKKVKNPSYKGNLKSLSGKRLAIDAPNWIYKQFYGAQKRNISQTTVELFTIDRVETIRIWCRMAVNFVIELLELGINPIFVFDGPPHLEKLETQRKRKDKTSKNIDRIKYLEEEKTKYDTLCIPQTLIEELTELYKNTMYISKSEQEYLKGILSGIGIPVLEATHDGEELCSMLCIEGFVSAVYSSDKDNLVYGCPFLITEIGSRVWNKETESYDRQITIFELSKVLLAFGMSFETFVDLCIMAGNDYNDNISMFGIGKAYDFLIKNKSIENLDKDVTILNYKKSREIFSVKNAADCWITGQLELNNLPECVCETLNFIQVSDLYEKYVSLYKNCIKVLDKVGKRLPTRKIVVIKSLTINKKEEESKVEEPKKKTMFRIIK